MKNIKVDIKISGNISDVDKFINIANEWRDIALTKELYDWYNESYIYWALINEPYKELYLDIVLSDDTGSVSILGNNSYVDTGILINYGNLHQDIEEFQEFMCRNGIYDIVEYITDQLKNKEQA